MKKHSCALLFLALPLFAQSPQAELLSYAGQRIGNTPQAQIAASDNILRLASELRFDSTLARFTDSQQNTYSAMVISPTQNTVLNKEAVRVKNALSGLPLVFSPYDLSRSGSLAFFDPNGSRLGVSYGFLVNGPSDPSYQHELFHAQTHQQVLNNQRTLWAGVMKVREGSYLSPLNMEAYFRFSSLDELPATALSVKLETQYLMSLPKTARNAEDVLRSIFYSLKSGVGLARQARDLSERALRSLPQMRVAAVPLTLGQRKAQVQAGVFLLESYSNEIVNGRGQMVPKAQGSEFTLYLPSDMPARLGEIIKRSALAEKQMSEALKCINVMIDVPKLNGSNMECLKRSAPQAFDQLVR